MILSRPFELCCVGAGGHGRVVATQYLARTGGCAVFADEALARGTGVAGIPVRFTSLEEIDSNEVIVTIGDNEVRRSVQGKLARLGKSVGHFVADEKNYFTAEPGDGSVVLAGAIVCAEAIIGDGVIVNTAAVVEHDCQIGDFSHISPNACLAGGVVLGPGCWIGAGATILPGVAIAANTVIGAGAVVHRDIATAGTYVGVPASRVSRRER